MNSTNDAQLLTISNRKRTEFLIGFLTAPFFVILFYFLLTILLSILIPGIAFWWPPGILGWASIGILILLSSVLAGALYRSYHHAQMRYVGAKLENSQGKPESHDQITTDEGQDSEGIRLLLGLLALVVGVILVLGTMRASVIEFINGSRNLPEFLLVFTLMGYFPLSYIAYHQFRSQGRIERLKKDLELLGYQEENAGKLYERAHNRFSYLLFVGLTMLMVMLGTGLFFSQLDNYGININTTLAMRYGFLGGYIFSAYLVYRRYSTNDLNPQVYLYCAFTMIAGIGFNFVAVEALTFVAGTEGAVASVVAAGNIPAAAESTPATGIGAGLLAILAFSIGYFPYLAVRWFNAIAHRVLQIGQRRADEMPLGMLDGISDWHETRLRDNGIDDVQNLAAVEIRDLLVNTAFSSQQVIAWIDQAILYVYLEPSEIQSFRRAKVNMASDFRTLWDMNHADPDRKQALAQALQSTPEKLEMLYSSISEGPNIHRVLNYWSSAQRDTDINRGKPKIDELRSEVKAETQKLVNLRDQTESNPAKVFGTVTEILEIFVKDLSIMGLDDFGDLHLMLRNYDKAIQHYNDAIKTSEANASIYSKLAIAYGQLRNYEEAIKYGTQAIERTSDTETEAKADAYGYRGIVHAQFGNYTEAQRDLMCARDLQPDNSVFRNYLASYIVSMAADTSKLNGEKPDAMLETALQEARKAVDLAMDRPNGVDCLDTLALTQIRMAILKADADDLPAAEDLLDSATENLRIALEAPPEQLLDYVCLNLASRFRDLMGAWKMLMDKTEDKSHRQMIVQKATNCANLTFRIPRIPAEVRNDLQGFCGSVLEQEHGSNGSAGILDRLIHRQAAGE